MQATMRYDYSTKNFHRYQAVGAGAPKEVYVPRAEMSHPVAEITVTAQISDHTLVVERVKVK